MRRINILKVVFEGKDKIESCHCVCKFTGNYVSVGGFNLHLLLTLNGCIANQLNQVFVNYSKFCITTELTVYAIAFKWHCLNAPSVEILKNRSLPFDSSRKIGYRTPKSEDFFQRLTVAPLYNAGYRNE